MLTFKIVLFIMFVVLFLGFMPFMVILEKDKPKIIIFWIAVFLILNLVGFIAYLILQIFNKQKSKVIYKKINDDKIYFDLISNKISNCQIKTTDNLFKFNETCYNAYETKNNSVEVISNIEELKENLIKDILSAENKIYLELNGFNAEYFSGVVDALAQKSIDGVSVKIVYTKHIKRKVLAKFKASKIKAVNFNSRYFSKLKNEKNVITIDDKISYICDLSKDERKYNQTEFITYNYKIKGNIVSFINLSLYNDIMFSSNKFLDFNIAKNDLTNNTNYMQLISNNCGKSLESATIKAIMSATSYIQIQLKEFIPSYAFFELLKTATFSGIDVRLIVPIKTNNRCSCNATSAFAKELASIGANVYLYDGEINNNVIVIDGQYSLFGSYTLNKCKQNSIMQDLFLLRDEKTANQFKKYFDNLIDNSYRINNSNSLTTTEKFNKKIV